ncbi:glycosyl hydrolase family 61-domain-containing protein [Auriculariales sp. MPI-PUGE-AT-0066]|nr:glycosyl hydrolase family 61-domain-containing protein [Auriculariales sp. MPI-PUGE-AT-0066]
MAVPPPFCRQSYEYKRGIEVDARSRIFFSPFNSTRGRFSLTSLTLSFLRDTMKFFFSTLLVFVASSSLVQGHGWVSSVMANGKIYKAPVPNGEKISSPHRQINSINPIRDLNSVHLTCGYSAKAAPLTMEVTAGTNILYKWWAGNQNWPHKYGPVMLYAYKCPGAAKDCMPGHKKGWALIDAAGFEANGVDWIQNRFYKGQGVAAHVPAGMPDGVYLFRHEIIALHIADTVGPSSTQAARRKNATMETLGAELVSLPGAYKKGNPSLFKSIFNGTNKKNYRMPGPKLFNPSNNHRRAETGIRNNTHNATASSS